MLNFLKIDRLLTKSFTQSFQERKESQGSTAKNLLPEEAPKKKSPKGIKELSRL